MITSKIRRTDYCAATMHIQATLVDLLFFALLITFEQSHGIKVHKTKRTAMEEMTGTKQEVRQFFSNCEQVSNGKACRLTIDDELIDELSQCAAIAKPTSSVDFPWWKGHLDVPVFVQISVSIINTDLSMVTETGGLMHFNLLGNGNFCYTHSGAASFNSKTFLCDMLADEIEIRSHVAGSVLALCDVTVMGGQLKFHMTQLADFMEMNRCKQSSVQDMFTCYSAIDGFQSMDPSQGGCAVTKVPNDLGPTNEPAAYWWTSFTTPGIVALVTLMTADKNIRDARVIISNRICSTVSQVHSNDIAHSLMCNHFGNELLVHHARFTIPMIVCEVQVRGFKVQLLPESRRAKVGCFNNKPVDPNMGTMSVSIVAMSLDKCDKACRKRQKRYMGLELGMEYWCADSYGKYGQIEDQDACALQCEGRKFQNLCGGRNAIAVYELK